MKAREAVRELSKIAEAQRGLVTTRQAARTGVPRLTLTRLEDDGAIERLTHGVYRVGGAPHAEHESLRAHWLALDPERTVAERLADKSRMIAVSHRSAADVHGIGDLDADEHQYTTTYRKQSAREGVRVSQRAIDASDVQVADGMLVTTPERTIADLARTEPDESHVANALGDAIIARRTSRDKVVGEVAGRSAAERERTVDRMLAYKGLDSTGLARTIANSMTTIPDIAELTRPMRESFAPALELLRIQNEASAKIREALDSITPALGLLQEHKDVSESLREAVESMSPALGQFRELVEASESVRKAIESVTDSLPSRVLEGVPWDTLYDTYAIASLAGGERDDD